MMRFCRAQARIEPEGEPTQPAEGADEKGACGGAARQAVGLGERERAGQQGERKAVGIGERGCVKRRQACVRQ